MNKGCYPLTQSQSLLWLGQELNPDTPMYNMVMTYDLRVAVEEVVFKKAFTELLRRFDALRTILVVENGLATQRFQDDLFYELEYIDVSLDENPEKSYNNWLKNRVKHQFKSLTILFDSALVKLGELHYVWYINQHHLITDAWSNSILFNTISELYSNYKISESYHFTISKNAPTFKSYIENALDSETGAQLKKSEEFWSEKMNQASNLPDLYGRTNSNAQSGATRHYINLGLEKSKKLRELANEKGIRGWTLDLSLYNIFLTTLFAFLNRVSGQENLSIGSPTHNRVSKTLKETVGYFVEIFPLTVEVDTKDNFFSLFQKVQLETNEFLKHAKPGLSNARLHKNFNVLFNYINADYKDFEGEAVTSHWVHPGHHDPRHLIRLHVHDFHNSGEIQLYIDLNNTAFSKEQQQIIPQHFITLLDAFAEDKMQAIRRQSLISSEEVACLAAFQKSIQLKNDTFNDIVTLFEQQVKQTPNATSISFNGEKITYKALNEIVNKLAHYLKSKHVGANTNVAIQLKRSPEYVISVLAILKAGATYIPIPFHYPQERVAYIVEDSQSKILIGHQTDMPPSHATYYEIDTLLKDLSINFSIENPRNTIHKAHTAFLIYTSGSTGNPKGVKITQEAISNYIKWTKKAYLDTHNITGPQIPLFTTVGFDITANSVFLPLICGGAIRIYQEDDNSEIDLSIVDVIEDNSVDFIKLTPAHLSFLKGKNFEQNTTKVLVVTGDEFKTDLANNIYKAFGGKIKMYNEYGPSEATIGCTYHMFDPNFDVKPGVPIGKPITGIQVFILDEYLNQVPLGVLGELYLGGIGLSSGYWNREALTAEKFIDNPFNPNSKLYKTEDLVRVNENGVLEFLGRTDFQVKINGYRIELGEIEYKITSFPKIQSCTVLALTDDNESKNLVAYFTAAKTINLPELKQYLEQKLPRYMLPSQYKQLSEMPLSANGKVDRKALRSIQADAVTQSTVYRAPKNEIEQEIAEVWCTVFKLKKISIDESFIGLGGDSLMAIQIATRMSDCFEFKIALNKIFELQTIENMSKYIEETLIELLNE